MLLATGITVSVLLIVYKTGWLPRVVGHQALADTVFTVALAPLIGADTLGGLAALVWGGVFFSVAIWILGKFVTPVRYVRGEGWVEQPSPLDEYRARMKRHRKYDPPQSAKDRFLEKFSR